MTEYSLDKMEHDRLCNSEYEYCFCSFIESIREDEREQAVQRIYDADLWPCDECDNARIAITAVRGEDMK